MLKQINNQVIPYKNNLIFIYEIYASKQSL